LRVAGDRPSLRPGDVLAGLSAPHGHPDDGLVPRRVLQPDRGCRLWMARSAYFLPMSGQAVAKRRRPDPRSAHGPVGRSGAAISQKRLFWLQFRRHKLALASLAVLSFLALLVVLAPLIAPYPFDAIDTTQFRKPPSFSHIMGT